LQARHNPHWREDMADTEGTATVWEGADGRPAFQAPGHSSVRITSLCAGFGIIAALPSWGSTPMPTAMVVIGLDGVPFTRVAPTGGIGTTPAGTDITITECPFGRLPPDAWIRCTRAPSKTAINHDMMPAPGAEFDWKPFEHQLPPR